MASENSNDSDRIFPHSAGSYKNALKTILEKIHEDTSDFPCPTLHALRHSFASAMAARGVPAKVLMGWLGHSKVEMTLEIYAQVMTDSTDRVIAERLSGFAGL